MKCLRNRLLSDSASFGEVSGGEGKLFNGKLSRSNTRSEEMGACGRVLLALDLNNEAVVTSYNQRLTGTRNCCGSLPVNETCLKTRTKNISLSLCALVVMEIYHSWCVR